MIKESLVDLVADVDQRVPVLVGEEPSDTEVAGVVDGRLCPQRAALFEVLLDFDARKWIWIAASTPRLKTSAWNLPGVRRVTRRPKMTAALIGATEGELIGKRCFEPCASGGGPIKHPRVGDLQLPERKRVPVSASAVLVGQG